MNQPLTIEETQKGLFEKKFKVTDLVSKYLSNIDKKNKDLNIFLTVDTEGATKKAKEIDRLLEENNFDKKILTQYPLLGAVVAHKDIFLTKGLRTTAASKVLVDYVPSYSAQVVNKMDQAKAITIGKVNCDAWAHGSSGENSDFGPTKNPWNRDFTPGGSSSGSGAALSSNMALISTGTDTCGSIRLPANYNYLVALKPTYGAISRYGVIAMASSLDTVGPIGRTVADCKKVFDTIKGEDKLDSTLKNEEPDFGKKKEFTIGIPKEFFEGGLDKEVAKNIDEVVKIYRNIGVNFKEVSLPSTKYGINVYYVIQPVEVASNLARFDGIRFGKNRANFGAEAKRRIMLGTYVSSAGYYDAYYLNAMKVRNKIKMEIEKVFNEVDALISPVAPSAPFKLGEKISDPVKMYLTDIFAATANLCGIPSIAMPHNFTSKGLPLGFQLMGPRFSEELLFRLGTMFHNESGYVPKIAEL